ncbi:MAG TPA: hypothetical protein VH107_20540 [Lacipirellulaceae bacterium]|jgi:hypothetical protein|nr:hypothetical protein [Lacipirellulaceae bacterium]
MRSFLTALLWVAVIVPSINAQDQGVSLESRRAARRELEQAKSELYYYWQVDYPRQCREYDAAIECARAEIDANRSLLREYKPFGGFSIGEPFPITVRNIQLCIRTGELRLNDLLAERNALMRFHGDQFRALSAQVYEARVRVAALEANDDDGPPAAEQLPAK